MSLEGYSCYQKGSIDVLTEEVGKKEVDVTVKVVTSEYNGIVQSLDAKDNSHFNRIDNLKQTKVVLSDYNTKMTSMDNLDTQHNIKLNALDTNYGTKASKMVFDNEVLELQALDENHDMRIDEIDNRFSTIHTQLYETVVQKLGKKINSADFYALLNQVNVGQTGLAGDIATLLLQNQMEAVNANQNLLITGKADKAEFDNNAEAIDDRHMDIEEHLLAIDQFLRLMSQTYKIYNKTTNEEIKYNANLLPVPTPPTFSVIGRKTLISGNNRSIDRSNISFVDNVVVQMTDFGYNTLTGSISIFNQNGDVVGSITQEDINPVTKNADVPLTGVVSGSIQVSQVSSDNTPVYTPPPISTVTTLTDLTPIDIINTNITIDGVIDTSVLVETDIQGTGTITVSPALPNGLVCQILNRKLRIYGTPTQAVAVSTPYTITVNNGFSSDSITVNIRVIELAPVYTYNASYIFTKKHAVNIMPTKISGSNATSWSVADGNNVLGSNGLMFNTSSGIISGIPTGTLETMFSITYSNSGGQGTFILMLVINPESPVYNFYSPSNIVFTVGDSVNIPFPTLGSGDTATNWSISPALPVGLSINNSTGLISGIANIEQINTQYQISYSNVSGGGSRQLGIRINKQAPTYTYNESYSFTKGVAITTITPTKVSGDDATTWSISPALSAGLSFDTSTGVISGTPTVAKTQTSYAVTYTNSGGAKNVFFTITVNMAPPVYNNYSPATYSFKVGDTVSIPFPTLASGDAATLWQISPILQGGINMATGTGLISGVANAVAAQTTYTITFSNSAGSGTKTVTITIDPLNKGLARNWLRYFKNSNVAKTTSNNYSVFDSNGNIYTAVSNYPAQTPIVSSIQKVSADGNTETEIFKTSDSIYSVEIDRFNYLYLSTSTGITKIQEGISTPNATYALPSNTNGYLPIYVDKTNDDIYTIISTWNNLTTGPTFSNLTMGGTFTANQTNIGIIKFNNSLVPQWGKWLGYGSVSKIDITTDNFRNVFVSINNGSGFFTSGLTGVSSLSLSSVNTLVTKFNSSGSVLTSQIIYGNNILIDSSNNIYMVGNSSADFTFSGTTFGSKWSTQDQQFILKYDSNFTPLWRRWGDFASTGQVYRTVMNTSTIDRTTGEIYVFETLFLRNKWAVSKYSSSGSKIMTLEINSWYGGSIAPTDIKMYSVNQNIVITGTVNSASGGIMGFTDKNSTNIGNTGSFYNNGYIATLTPINI